jgi:solute carrier family 45 protein 1/2/4
VSLWSSRKTPLSHADLEAVSSCARVEHAFASLYHEIRARLAVRMVYWVTFFLAQYGYTTYNGNTGQFS